MHSRLKYGVRSQTGKLRVMSDFSETWSLVRGRFEKEFEGLNQEQINWRLQPKSLTIAEQVMHTAGVEASFIHQLTGEPLDDFGERVRASATDGVTNETGFPFSVEEMTPEMLQRASHLGRRMVEKYIDPLSDEIRQKEIKSALGPIITGTGAFARISYHPGYHQAQIYMIKSAPGFPRGT
jgi:hypothetical protein